MVDEQWLDQAITRRQFLSEAAMIDGAPWSLAVEAASSTLLEHPELDADETRARRDWYDHFSGPADQ